MSLGRGILCHLIVHISEGTSPFWNRSRRWKHSHAELLNAMLTSTIMPTALLSRLYLLFVLTYSVTAVHERASNDQSAPRDLDLPILPDNAVNTTAILNVFPNCFQHTRDPRRPPQLFPAKITDCAFILYHILSGPNAAIPMPWHDVVPQSPEYVRRWYFGTCTVALQASSPDTRDLFPEMLIARQAALAMSACLTSATGQLGGSILIGSRKAYKVIVGGQIR